MSELERKACLVACGEVAKAETRHCIEPLSHWRHAPADTRAPPPAARTATRARRSRPRRLSK
eukprot:4237800-Prymnesium_polylepis.1